MAKTLLAVDDSVTMRKVLEITFSGEDFTVMTAESSQSAITKVSENPNVVVIDTVLGGEDGYALAKELRKRSPASAIIMLASRYNPYDQARGRDAGADDWADKPFDTQQLIDKIRKVMLAREAGGVGTAPAAAAAGSPYRAPAPPAAPPPVPTAAPIASPAPPPVIQQAPPSMSRGTQPSLGGSMPRPQTAVSPVSMPMPAPVAAAPPPAPVAMQSPAASTQPGISRVGDQVNGHLSTKLGELGLSPAQAEAVMALSREVVERVVWEVVPQLAETIIKEEIARLTRE